MTATIASHILDCIRDHMHLHVGFCQWTRDDGVSLWACSARNSEGRRWVWERFRYRWDPAPVHRCILQA